MSTEVADRLVAHLPPAVRARARELLAALPYFRAQLALLPEEMRTEALVWPARPPDAAHVQPEDGDFAAQQARMRRLAALARVQTIWWEFGAQGAPERGWRALSRFCDVLIAEGMRIALALAAARHPAPEGFRCAVIALGKLGGEEVNLASDWDLIWVWDAEEAEAGVFAQRALQLFLRLFAERTPEGQAWRVDLRLRPGGESAPIATRLPALVAHLESYAQTWERAAWLRARAVAGDRALAREVERLRRAFVFRRHLDYAALAALAEMKARMDAQAGTQSFGPGWDIKRGRGGIREAEFFVQAMQLVHGGRKAGLRVRPLLAAIQALQAEGLLAAEEAQAHAADYTLLRRMEHAWQAARGDIGHRTDETLASILRAAMPETPEAALRTATGRVAARFQALFAAHATPAPAFPWDNPAPWAARFPEPVRAHAQKLLEEIGAWLARGILPERASRHVARFLAEALPAWARDTNGARALALFLDLLRRIHGRTHWLDLLAHHEGARRWLIGVLAAGRFLAERVAHEPAWLEWPLAAERGEAEIAALIREIRAAGAMQGEEARARLARAVEQARITLALGWDAHRLHAIELGRAWADVADAAVQAALAIAQAERGLAEARLAVVALGKHGSREMSLASDLDLVFLADGAPDANIQRLGRRLIAILTQRPPFGAGFAIDMRLRPSGRQGILVSSLSAFAEYQRRWALVWEHQALVRARVIAGPEDLRRKVEAAIADVLAMERNPARIAAEMRAMRAKMEAHHAVDARFINLKHGAGGMSDIEFLAQFARLVFHEGAPGVRETLLGLRTAPQAWREAAPALAEAYATMMQAREALWVELELPCERIPRNADDPAWTTLARHAGIPAPEDLLARMQRTRADFLRLLEATG